MKFFDHLNVLTLVGVCVDSGPAPYILMPFMSHESLLSYLTKESHNLTVAEGSDQELLSPVQKQWLSQCTNSITHCKVPFHSPAFHSPDDVLLEENADKRPSFAELEMSLTSILELLSWLHGLKYIVLQQKGHRWEHLWQKNTINKGAFWTVIFLFCMMVTVYLYEHEFVPILLFPVYFWSQSLWITTKQNNNNIFFSLLR